MSEVFALALLRRFRNATLAVGVWGCIEMGGVLNAWYYHYFGEVTITLG